MSALHSAADTTLHDGVGRRTVRATAHVHSEWSDDGSWSLHRIAATFGRFRCAVVLMSEHSRNFTSAKWQEYIEACAAASTSRVTLVPGIEYGDDDDVVHIPVWGDVPFFGQAPRIGALLAEVSEAGATAVWAHPRRRDAWRRFDPSWRQHLTAIEVWNRKYDGIAPDRRSVDLSRLHQTRAFVSLDFHTRRQLFPLSLALALSASRADVAVSPASVYQALQAGSFTSRAFGLPIEPLTAGPPAVALRALESGRRMAARLVRMRW